MTNKEKIIEIICEESGCDVSVVSRVFEIVNKKDWADFCSEMGDYDHPEERVQAEKVFDLQIAKYADELDLSSSEILIELSNEIIHCELYRNSFHKMNQEYEL